MLDVKIKELSAGTIVTATVVSVKDRELLLDLNYMTEGTMYLDAYSYDKKESFKDFIKVGDVMTAVVKKISERDDSVLILLSRLPLLKKDLYEEVKEDFNNKTIVKAKVSKVVPKGLMLTYKSFDFFLHESQIEFPDLETPVSLDSYKGKELDVKIIELDEKKRRFTVSRREHLRDEYYKKKKADYTEMIERRSAEKLAYQEAKEKEYNDILVGDVKTGTVFKIEKYGVFVRFEVCHGLVRTSQLSHLKIADPKTFAKIGDSLEVQVIKKDAGQIDLSVKVLTPTPHKLYAEKHKIGSEVAGTVIQKLPFGIILQLTDGVTGLLHRNEYSWNPNSNFAAGVKIGDELSLVLQNIDITKERINLSKKALEDNPWGKLTHQLGDDVEVKVVSIVPGKSLIVEVQEVEGVILINELSTQKLSKIEDFFAVGDIIKAKIVELNKAEWILSLSIKRLQEEEERKNFDNYLEKQEAEDSKTTLGDVFKDVLKK